MPPRVTLRDLAAETGLHFTTVGLALRRDRRVNAQTLALVEAAAQRLGYRRDAMLSALSAYRHTRKQVFQGTIGYLLPAPFRQMMDRNDGYRIAYESASRAAEALGLRIEAVNAGAPGMTARRLAQLLEARAIGALILAPVFQPGAYFELPWERFSAVAIGYSVLKPGLHRVSVHHARSVWMLVRELRASGYRRIGLVLHRGGDIRTDHNFLGAYLAEQQWQPASLRVRPLLCDEEVPELATLQRWLKTERPDCVIGSMPDTLTQLQRLGQRVPDDLGFAILGIRPHSPGLAGTNENWEGIGQAAVDLVFALMKNRETGVPEFPRFALVEAKWSPGSTVRSGEPRMMGQRGS